MLSGLVCGEEIPEDVRIVESIGNITHRLRHWCPSVWNCEWGSFVDLTVGVGQCY